VSYEITSRDYLKRALAQIAEESEQALFYAAFELRCGIEARMQQYLRAWNEIFEKKKQKVKEWQIDKLARDIEAAFKTGNRLIRIGARDKDSKELMVCFYHTPVTSSLRTKGKKLGDVLHAMKEHRTSDDTWWEKFRTELAETAAELRIANIGTLLGPPTLLRPTEDRLLMEMQTEEPPGRDVVSTLGPLGGTLHIEFDCPPSLPHPIEPEALVWDVESS
jgi:hypothetical protein